MFWQAPLTPTSIPAPTHCPFQTPQPGRDETLLIDRQHYQTMEKSKVSLSRVVSASWCRLKIRTNLRLRVYCEWSVRLGRGRGMEMEARGRESAAVRRQPLDYSTPAPETKESIFGLRALRAYEPMF